MTGGWGALGSSGGVKVQREFISCETNTSRLYPAWACLRLAGAEADAAVSNIGAGGGGPVAEDVAGAGVGFSYPATRRSRNGWQK